MGQHPHIILAAPRGAGLLSLFTTWQRQLSQLPPTGKPEFGEGSRGWLRPHCDPTPRLRCHCLFPRDPAQGLLTSHHIQVRQSRGGVQRPRGWKRGHGSREWRVGHLKDQRGLEEMGAGGQGGSGSGPWPQITAIQPPACSCHPSTKEDGSDRAQLCSRRALPPQSPISTARWSRAQTPESGSTTQELCNCGQDL